MDAVEVARAVEAIRSGKPVLLPADGVYGLCAGVGEEAVRSLYELKGRGHAQPTAVIAASTDALFELVPELDERSRKIAAALLPGPYTLVLANPAGRLPWLNGADPGRIGVRVARLPAATQEVLDAVGAVAATSANDPGDPAAAVLDDVPQRIRAGCGAEVDGGRLSGLASTVIDFAGAEPLVLRDGAGPAVDALACVERALSG